MIAIGFLIALIGYDITYSGILAIQGRYVGPLALLNPSTQIPAAPNQGKRQPGQGLPWWYPHIPHTDIPFIP